MLNIMGDTAPTNAKIKHATLLRLTSMTCRGLNRKTTTYIHNTLLNSLTNFNLLPAHPSHELCGELDGLVQKILRSCMGLTFKDPPHSMYLPLSRHGNNIKTFFLSTLQAFAQEMEIHLTSNTQIERFLAARLADGSPTTPYVNYVHTSLADLAMHGIYLRKTTHILASTTLSTLLSPQHNAPRPATLGNEGYTPGTPPKSGPFLEKVDDAHLAFAYNGTYHHHIATSLANTNPRDTIHPHPRGYLYHLFHTATNNA